LSQLRFHGISLSFTTDHHPQRKRAAGVNPEHQAGSKYPNTTIEFNETQGVRRSSINSFSQQIGTQALKKYVTHQSYLL
jgi:hypothetical protein